MAMVKENLHECERCRIEHEQHDGADRERSRICDECNSLYDYLTDRMRSEHLTPFSIEGFIFYHKIRGDIANCVACGTRYEAHKYPNHPFPNICDDCSAWECKGVCKGIYDIRSNNIEDYRNPKTICDDCKIVRDFKELSYDARREWMNKNLPSNSDDIDRQEWLTTQIIKAHNLLLSFEEHFRENFEFEQLVEYEYNEDDDEGCLIDQIYFINREMQSFNFFKDEDTRYNYCIYERNFLAALIYAENARQNMPDGQNAPWIHYREFKVSVERVILNLRACATTAIAGRPAPKRYVPIQRSPLNKDHYIIVSNDMPILDHLPTARRENHGMIFHGVDTPGTGMTVLRDIIDRLE
jgi:hypothetical protein